MIAATLLPILGANGDPARAIALASMLALLVGGITLLASVAKLGFVADLLSKPTQVGYMNGLALTILVGQLPKLFGFSVDADGLVDETSAFVRGVVDGETVAMALAVGLGGVVLMVAFGRWLPKVPGVLVAVVLSVLVASWLGLADRGVTLVGELPQGFPPFTLPHIGAADLPLLIGGALGIALVSLADTISTASAFAARTGQEVDGNQEMVGIGMANVASGLFQGFPVSTSGSRTAVAMQAGARSQVTGIVGAGAITLIILALPGLLRNLPQPTLAAVVIVASLSLADIPAVVRLWRRSRTEFTLSMAAFLGVAMLGVLPGIAVAVGLSILNVFRRAWWPDTAVLGRVEDMAGYHALSSHPEGSEVPGLTLFRFGAPLFFANARAFRELVRELAATTPSPRWIVVTAEPVTDIDTSAADVLEQLHDELAADGITLVFAELKHPVRLKMDRFGLIEKLGPARFFPTIEAAVAAFQQIPAPRVAHVDPEEPTGPRVAPGGHRPSARP
jgi:high affinity sulfate transporter 1